MANSKQAVLDRYHHNGNRRTLDREKLLDERERIKTLPPSPERTAALLKISRSLYRMSTRSPWRD